MEVRGGTRDGPPAYKSTSVKKASSKWMEGPQPILVQPTISNEATIYFELTDRDGADGIAHMYAALSGTLKDHKR